MTPEQFNSIYSVGDKFKYYSISGSPVFQEVESRSEAWELGHGEVVVKVTGRSGGVSIGHLVEIQPSNTRRE